MSIEKIKFCSCKKFQSLKDDEKVKHIIGDNSKCCSFCGNKYQYREPQIAVRIMVEEQNHIYKCLKTKEMTITLEELLERLNAIAPTFLPNCLN